MSSSTRPTGHPSLRAAIAGITAAAAVLYGCTGNVGVGPGGAPISGTGGGGGSGGGGPLTPEEQFEAMRQDLLDNCGACHLSTLPDFLKEPTYETVKAHPGLVLKNWEASKFLTISAGSMTTHTGPEIDVEPLRAKLWDKMRAWLEAEAARLPDVEPGVKRVGPFPVNTVGFNSYYFSGLGEEFKDIALTFNAAVDPAVPGVTLLNMKINPSKSTGVHLVNPTFQVFLPGAETGEDDPNATFAMFDQTYQPNETGPFVPDTFTLANWTEGALIGIVFETAEVLDGMGGVNCGDLASFTANAQTPLRDSCAAACHAGGNPTAQGAMDLSALDTDPDLTCAIVRNRVDLVNADQSQIFLNSDPAGGANHMFKFDTPDNFILFRDAVKIWIAAEAAAPPPMP